MCGWVGILGTVPASNTLTAATASMYSRGPDAGGIRLVEDGPLPAGLGHRRLAILDPSPAGNQPMHLPELGVSVVYNGEIYNSPGLRRELETKGHTFRSSSDTEVLLRGWVEWGDQVLDRIEGMFSFLLLDEHRGRALAARDRLGVKPLYWARIGNVFLAGSTPSALLHLRPELGADVDRIAMAQFLMLSWIPHPRSPWKQIHKLPPGHCVKMADGQVNISAYWTPQDDPPTSVSPDELLDAIDGAVERQLLSDVPVGIFLSGGLDSSLLLALMDKHYKGDKLIATVNGYTDTGQHFELVPDDLPYAQQMAKRHARTTLRTTIMDDDSWRTLDTLGPHFDDPVADPAAIAVYLLSQASDSKVVLSGVGAEELFGGYPRHRVLPWARRAAGVPPSLRRALSSLVPLLAGGKPGPGFSLRRNSQKLARAIGNDGCLHYWRMVSQLSGRQLDALIPDAAHNAIQELDGQYQALASITLSEATRSDLGQFLANLNLAYVDKASMAASVEVRVPLLDEAVVRLALRSTESDLHHDNTQKAVLKTAARSLVPDEIIYRRKSGFGGPIRSWIAGPAADEFRQRIIAVADAGLVERKPALRLLARCRNGQIDAGYAVWALVALEVWHRNHASPLLTSRHR